MLLVFGYGEEFFMLRSRRASLVGDCYFMVDCILLIVLLWLSIIPSARREVFTSLLGKSNGELSRRPPL